MSTADKPLTPFEQQFAEAVQQLGLTVGLNPGALAQAAPSPFLQPYQGQPQPPLRQDAMDARAAAAIDSARKQQEKKEWESFQRGIRMATEALVDVKERARAWDSYVVAAMRAGKTDAEAVEVADSLLQERDGRFSDPKN